MDKRLKLLIAYDGSECADAALDDLSRAGLAKDVEALVMTVAEVWLPPPESASEELGAQSLSGPSTYSKTWHLKGAQAIEHARSLAMGARNRVQVNFPDWKTKFEVTSGSPAWELIVRADAWKPDLIVVGSHGRSALGRFVLGSVSQRVLTEARCSVRIARGRVEVDGAPTRILIGVDGSPGSEGAVSAVASRHWHVGTEVRVVVVEDPLVPTMVGHLIPKMSKWIAETNQGERRWIEKLAEHAVNRLRSSGIDATSVLMTGDPKRVLIDEAKRWRADSIFVGSTGFSNRFERFLLGSVSAAVAARAGCSVEVVRVAPHSD